jgi:hypothetical protein
MVAIGAALTAVVAAIAAGRLRAGGEFLLAATAENLSKLAKLIPMPILSRT